MILMTFKFVSVHRWLKSAMADRCITVNVVLASGRSTLLSAEPSCSIAELKAAAQQEFGHGFLTLLSEDGRQWNSICWCFFLTKGCQIFLMILDSKLVNPVTQCRPFQAIGTRRVIGDFGHFWWPQLNSCRPNTTTHCQRTFFCTVVLWWKCGHLGRWRFWRRF